MTVGMTAASYFGKKVVISGVTPGAMSALDNTSIEIETFPYKIGRKTDSFYRDLFSNNDLYIRDTKPYNISRNHLSIQSYMGKFFIIDRGSSLGTIVNDTRIGGRLQKHEIELLRNRENIVTFGPYESPFKFKVSIP